MSLMIPRTAPRSPYQARMRVLALERNIAQAQTIKWPALEQSFRQQLRQLQADLLKA